jgi:hypothetical protein
MNQPGTLILPCLCEHEDQDKMYGKGRRVHNRVDGKGRVLGYACTVCTPRRFPCEKNTAAVEPMPHLGLLYRIPAQKLRSLKQVSDTGIPTPKKKK